MSDLSSLPGSAWREHPAGTHREPDSVGAFEQFARSDALRLRRVLVARFGVEIGAEVCAEAMAYAWENWSRLAPMENRVGYLYRVAQSKARRHHRWRRDVSFPPEQLSFDATTDVGLHLGLGRLSEPQRMAVLLVHAHGWSYAEVADVLDIRVSAVRNHVHRGLTKLRTHLEQS